MTAVEWLANELEKKGSASLSAHYELFQQAKEMEKQQIINCSIITIQSYFIDSMNWLEEEIVFTENDLKTPKEYAEKYYNETFNK